MASEASSASGQNLVGLFPLTIDLPEVQVRLQVVGLLVQEQRVLYPLIAQESIGMFSHST